MKKLVLSILLLASSAVHAQRSPTPESIKLTVPCATQAKVVEVLKEYDERPMLQMVSTRDKEELTTIMFVNPKTLTYSIVEQVNENLYCVTGSGKGLMPYLGGAEVNPSKPPKNNY